MQAQLDELKAKVEQLTREVVKQRGKVDTLLELLSRNLAPQQVVAQVMPATNSTQVAPASALAAKRQGSPRHGAPWTEDERNTLIDLVQANAFSTAPDALGRTLGAVRAEAFRLTRKNRLTTIELEVAGLSGYEDWLSRQS